MNSIKKAVEKDFKILADLGKQTFIESHGKSAPQKDIESYINEKYSYSSLQAELENAQNIYHIIYHEKTPVGFSKIVMNSPHSNIRLKNVTKLERIYILKNYYDKKLGAALFDFNVQLSRANSQAGMWLFVWKENLRAVRFYIKHSFKIVGSYDFPISETHSNPNHQMFLEY
jgi:ribosomal protein S18 acetylase RimI-like enzyme